MPSAESGKRSCLPRKVGSVARKDVRAALKIITMLAKRNAENAVQHERRLMTLVALVSRLLQINLACQDVVLELLRVGYALQKSTVKNNICREPNAKEWWESAIDRWTNRKFMTHFRMSRESVDILVDKLGPYLQRHYRGEQNPLPVKLQVYVSLYCLGSTCLLRTGEHPFGLDLSTVWDIVRTFCKVAIKEMFPTFLPPISSVQADAIASRFLDKFGLLQCVGVVGTTHVKIAPPSERATDFFSKYHCHTIVMQAVTDADGVFLNAAAGYPGSMSNVEIFDSSVLGKMLEDGGGWGVATKKHSHVHVVYYVIGGREYPLKTYLMREFAQPPSLTNQHIKFNNILSSGRAIIDQTFDAYKGRWRILLYVNKSTIPTVTNFTLACVALHNFCAAQNETILPEWLENLPEPLENNDESGSDEDHDYVEVEGEEDTAAKLVRDTLMKIVSW